MEAVVHFAVILHAVADHRKHVLELGERLDVHATARAAEDNVLLEHLLERSFTLVRGARCPDLRNGVAGGCEISPRKKVEKHKPSTLASMADCR